MNYTNYKLEVLVDGKWSSNSIVYKTEREAMNAGAELLSRWMAPTDYRAAKTDKPATHLFDVERFMNVPLPA